MEKFTIIGGKLIIGRDEFTYQEVLDSFESSDFIGVITYYVGDEHGQLINRLKEACQNGSSVILVTNIPKRFAQYYGDCYEVTFVKR